MSLTAAAPAARRHRPDVEQVETGVDELEAVADRLLGGAAARPLEHRVGGDVDAPGGHRELQVESPVGELPDHAATVATAPCRCDASTPTSTGPCSAGAARSSATPREASRLPRGGGWRPAIGPV